MHLCQGDPGGVDLPEPTLGIADEQLTKSAPLVRALVVQRLELMWRTCEPFISTESGKPDPRFIEAGIRVTDRLTALYRLLAPTSRTPEADPGSRVDARELVRAQVRELEARMGQSQPPTENRPG